MFITRRKKYIISAITTASIAALYTLILGISCNGGKGDPTGALQGLLRPDGKTPSTESGGINSNPRTIWGGYLLDINPLASEVSVKSLDRGLQAHYNVTGLVKKPACPDCIQLSNIEWDKSAGMLELDAKLINPSAIGGYDVRAVLLIDEWSSGRKLESADGLTDFWSKDSYHPDPFINYSRENSLRFFGPYEQHSAHVKLYFPKPLNFAVPFIIDASYPGHPEEPVEMMNIKVVGSVHPTGYDLKLSVDLLDWQNNATGVYIDCSSMNPMAGSYAFQHPTSQTSSTWTIDLKYDPQSEFNWLPTESGAVDLPIYAKDPTASEKLFQRIRINITSDDDPPEWTGETGISQVWWGGSRAVVAFYPATDPSGPVKYNIYKAGGDTGKETVVGCSHYAVEIPDDINVNFIVKAVDSAGNETTNTNAISGKSKAITKLWSASFPADIESSPTVVVGMNHYGVEYDSHSVIFGCDDGKVYAMSGITGQQQWAYSTGSMVKGTPALRDFNYDGKIDAVLGSNDKKVYVLNGSTFAGTPAPLTTFTATNVIESSPVCADQVGSIAPEVAVGSFDGKLYAFAGGTGNLLVSYDTEAPVKATPSLEDFDGDSHYDMVVASGGVIQAINGINGQKLWSYNFQTGFTLGSPAIGDLNSDGTGDVVLGCGNTVYALDIKHHSLLWSTIIPGGDFDTSPALGDVNGDGVPDIAISSRYMNVALLNGADGSIIWISRDAIYMPTSPTMADMNADGIVDVVIGSADGNLRVLNGADGLTLYKYMPESAGGVTTIPLIADVNHDGLMDIVFGSQSHVMTAISTNQAVPNSYDLIPWPKFMRNLANTGNLSHPLY